MKILFVSSEAAPFIKSGGLGEVSFALPKELAKSKSNEVCVFLPFYGELKNLPDIKYLKNFYTPLSWRSLYTGLFTSSVDNVTFYFIDNEYYFARGGLYGYPDDGERFAFFSKAVLESLQYIPFQPDVIHSNDWHTGFIPLFLKAFYPHINAKTVFTIHNIEYQGKADMPFVTDVLGTPPSFTPAVEFNSLVNAMKCAIVLSDKVTTVSKTYSCEILYPYFAHGLAGILSENRHKLYGIINGIDTVSYNPKTDTAIPQNYSPADLSGKTVCKRTLQRTLSLPESADTPIVSMVTRLVSHKGMELLEYIGEEMMYTCDIQLVLLGTGNRRFEDYMSYLAYKFPDKVSANIKFDSALARIIYAGSDLHLMPSKSEPCGLSQLIAMRYGTIPVVHETGGLVDTVPPINPETLDGNGITFKVFNAHDMLDAVRRGADFVRDRAKAEKIIKKIMRLDFSWKSPAAEYMALYRD